MRNGAGLDDAVARRQRRAMVERQLRARGIHDARVLQAMEEVPRHEFVRPPYRSFAYEDEPLPTVEGQTISQPYIVALMTQALNLRGGEKVLEIGTGSGYQTAILRELGAHVWTIERSPDLSAQATARLDRLGYHGIHLVVGDGTVGLPSEAPFDRILASGSFPAVPNPLLAQLVPGGILVAPIGALASQELVRIEYDPPNIKRKVLCPCRFVPLVGANGWSDADLQSNR